MAIGIVVEIRTTKESMKGVQRLPIRRTSSTTRPTISKISEVARRELTIEEGSKEIISSNSRLARMLLHRHSNRIVVVSRCSHHCNNSRLQ